MRWISYKWAGAILMVSWVASMLPLTVPTTFGILLAARIALGFFEGPAHALCQSVVADLFPKERRAFAGSIVNAGSSLGPLLSAPILTWIIISSSWHTAFAVLVGAGVVWLVVWLLYVDRQPLRKRSTAAVDDEDDPNGHLEVPFLRLLRLRAFWA